MLAYHRVIPTVGIQVTLWTAIKIRWIGTKLLKRSIRIHHTFLSKFFLWLMFKNKKQNKTKTERKSFLNIFNFFKNKLFCFTVVWKYVILRDWSNAGIKNMFWKSLLERFIILTSGYFKSPSIFMKTAKRSICFPNSRKVSVTFCQPWLNKWLWVKVIQLWSAWGPASPLEYRLKKQSLWTWAAHYSQGLSSPIQFFWN